MAKWNLDDLYSLDEDSDYAILTNEIPNEQTKKHL